MPRLFRLASACLLAVGLVASAPAGAERLKDLASIGGVRQNQLVGYGLVVGLDGSGDQTTQTPFTVQSIINMLGNLGVTLPPGQSLQLKNVAAVMVTASLPPFARPGQQIDVTVSSMGNARSLKGGTLVMTPLKGVDGQVYAMAQGSLAVSGASGAAPSGGKVTVNHLSAGRIPGGATVERSVPTAVGQGDSVFVELNDADFGTAQKVVDAINAMAPGTARAIDGLERALAGLGLLDQALALDLRKPQDYFRRVWSTAFRATDLADTTGTAHDDDTNEITNDEQEVCA